MPSGPIHFINCRINPSGCRRHLQHDVHYRGLFTIASAFSCLKSEIDILGR